jgi:methylthioribulose-1-phosphate dehydratase
MSTVRSRAEALVTLPRPPANTEVPSPWPPRDRAARALMDAARRLADTGQLRATSGNLSARLLGGRRFLMTASGTDKEWLAQDGLVEVDETGAAARGETRRPSAETALHLAVYRRFSSAGAVMHGHGRAATVMSALHAKDRRLTLVGLELLKALENHPDPEVPLTIPIFPNRQDVEALALEVENTLAGDARAFLLASHGLYTWGTTAAVAARHADALEFLLDASLTLRLLSSSPRSAGGTP